MGGMGEMTLRLGDVAPDFVAHSTEGPLNFHEWIGTSWVILFSVPSLNLFYS